MPKSHESHSVPRDWLSPVPSHGSIDPGSGTKCGTNYKANGLTEPKTGWLYCVRWLTDGGTERTKWYRHASGARRYCGWLADHEIPHRVYRTPVTSWVEVEP